MDRYKIACEEIDKAHMSDPNIVGDKGNNYPAELLYAKRLIDRLSSFSSETSEELLLATRCQHLRRWEIPRNKYPMNKAGYYQWRKTLYEFQSNEAEKILKNAGYSEEFIAEVKNLVGKKDVKSSANAQLLEDVACLVFIEFYFAEFSKKHDREKLKQIVVKTWKKMSAKAQQEALKIDLSEDIKGILQEALKSV